MNPVAVNDFANYIAATAWAAFLVVAFVYIRGPKGARLEPLRSAVGVIQSATYLSILAVLSIVLARRWLGEYNGYEWVAVVGYTLLTATGLALAVAIPAVRRSADRKVIPVKSTTVTAPEIWYKTQRVLRTIVQVGIPSFLAFALVLPQVIDALGLPVTSSLYITLLGIAAGVTAVAGALSRVMAIPAVNTWLTKIGLGSVPKAHGTVTDYDEVDDEPDVGQIEDNAVD